MKKITVVALLIGLSLIAAGCSNNSGVEDISLDSSVYDFERVFINAYKQTFDINVSEWEFIDNDMIYILDEQGREFLVEKSNVTFFSVNKEK